MMQRLFGRLAWMLVVAAVLNGVAGTCLAVLHFARLIAGSWDLVLAPILVPLMIAAALALVLLLQSLWGGIRRENARKVARRSDDCAKGDVVIRHGAWSGAVSEALHYQNTGYFEPGASLASVQISCARPAAPAKGRKEAPTGKERGRVRMAYAGAAGHPGLAFTQAEGLSANLNT